MSSNSKKILNVPNLRFKDFNGEYTKYRCSDFLNFYPTNSLSWDDLSYDPGDFYNVHYGLIHNGAPTSVDLNKYKLPSIKNFNLKKYTLCENGDVIFADASEDTEEICKPIEIINTAGEKIVSGLHTIHARDMRNLTYIGYKGYLFSSFAFHKQVFRLTQGTKVYSISSNNFKDLYVSLPSKKEQEKVVNLMQVIDKRIETQNKIIEDFESQIKWVRQKIFKSDSAKNKKSIGDFLESFSEKNTIGVKTPVAVGKYGIRKREDIYSKELTDDYSSNKIIRKNTFIIGMGSSQIDIGVLLDDEVYCVSPAYSTFKIKDINPVYFNEFMLFLNPLLSNKYMIVSARQGKSVNKKGLLAHSVLVHNADSQKLIANLFTSLYERIQKEKDMLNAYKKQKAYLLKEMFI